MAYIAMYDSAQNNQFPGNAQAYAGYVNGRIGDQPNYQWIVANFPHAYHLSISLYASQDANCLDIEDGAASPLDAADWYLRQASRGAARPCFYASADTMQSQLIPIVHASGFPREKIRLWSAHYGAGQHICGPSSCGLTSIDMDGTQWNDVALGRNLDESLLLGDFFGPVILPPQYTEFDMAKLRILRIGDTDQPGEFYAVRRLQALLKLTGQLNGIRTAADLAVDGDFGPATSVALRDVQAHYRISVDGVCGPATWSVLLSGSPT